MDESSVLVKRFVWVLDSEEIAMLADDDKVKAAGA
jgi:hypothetical protein